MTSFKDVVLEAFDLGLPHLHKQNIEDVSLLYPTELHLVRIKEQDGWTRTTDLRIKDVVLNAFYAIFTTFITNKVLIKHVIFEECSSIGIWQCITARTTNYFRNISLEKM